MGNPAKPRQLKLMPGTLSHRDVHGRKVGEIANIPRAIPLEPGWVQEDPIAHHTWATITPLLARVGLLHDGSAVPVGAYCAAVSRFVAANRGYMDGTVSSRELAEHDRSLRAWTGRLGLDPASEHILADASKEIAEEDDPFA